MLIQAFWVMDYYLLVVSKNFRKPGKVFSFIFFIIVSPIMIANIKRRVADKNNFR